MCVCEYKEYQFEYDRYKNLNFKSSDVDVHLDELGGVVYWECSGD